MTSPLDVLIVYGTGEGQTATVARRIADALGDRGHEATVVDAAELPADLAVADYDAVLVGASVHAGRHQRAVRAFVTDHAETLAARPTAFFQVSLSSATEAGREQAAGYVEDFLADTGFAPDRIGLFGGALRYSEYGFLKRLLMRQIARRAMQDADAGVEDEHGDVAFTDWAEVEAFAADVAAFVEGRHGVPPPVEGERGYGG